jgi:hypothetical protein
MTPTPPDNQGAFGFAEDVELARMARQTHARKIDELWDKSANAGEAFERIAGYIEEIVQAAELKQRQDMKVALKSAAHILAATRWRRIALSYQRLTEDLLDHAPAVGYDQVRNDAAWLKQVTSSQDNSIPNLDLDIHYYSGTELFAVSNEEDL